MKKELFKENLMFVLRRVCEIAAFLFSVCMIGAAHAQASPNSGNQINTKPFGAVQMPNGYYTETREDLRIKVLGGYVILKRAYWNRDVTKSAGEWVFNPAWVDLKFTLDSIDGSVKSVDRSGQVYERNGGDLYVLDKRFFIKKVSAAQWRWYDQKGNYILYNQSGKITSYGDRNNVNVTFTYTVDGYKDRIFDAQNSLVLAFSYSAGKLTAVTDRAGRSVQYTWAGDNLVQSKNTENVPTTFAYDAKGNVNRVIDEEGRTLDLVYAGNRVVKMAAGGLESTMEYSYDKVARHSIVVSSAAGAQAIRALYSSAGRVVGMQYGDRTLYAMSKDGDRTEVVVDERGYITRTEFDADRNPLRIVNPDGSSTTATYDARWSQPLTTTDEAGTPTKYEYDNKGNLIKLTEAVGTPDERVSQMAYDDAGQLLAATRKGKDGNPDVTVTYSYDPYGNRNSMTDAEGNRYEMTHDVMGNLLTMKTPRGHVYNYVVNKRGWTTQRTDPLGGVTQFDYDAVGNLTKETDERGKTFQYRYNSQGKQTHSIDAYNKAFVTDYSTFGYVQKETDEENRIVAVYNYNPQNYLTSQQDGKGNTTTFDYQNSAGQQAAPLGPSTVKYPTFEERSSYDNRFRLTQESLIFDADSQVTSYAYDGRGNQASETDANGKTTFFEYDAFNRPTKITNRVGAEVTMAYDERGNMVMLKDGKGNTHRFAFDKNNRLTQEILPLGQARSYTYDATSNIKEMREPNGQRVAYDYDGNDRLIKQSLFAASATTASQIYTLGYDASSNITSWTDGTYSGTITYDDNNRKSSETVNYGNAIFLTYRYTYFANGFKKTLTYPSANGTDGNVITYRYDASDEVSGINIPSEGDISMDTFKWTAPTSVSLPGGSKLEMSRDGLLRLSSLKAKNPSQTVVVDMANQYNRLQDLTKRTLDGKTALVDYDDAKRVTASTLNGNEAHTYDAVDNRVTSTATSGTWAYDANNRLTQRGAISYTYDASGNLILKSDATTSLANPKVTLYRYDALNRLVQVEDATGMPAGSTSGSVVAKYIYDPMNRRIIKEVASVPTLFLYSDEGVLVEADASGSVQKSYGWKPAADDSMSGVAPQFIRDHTQPAANQYAYFINDHAGSPIRALNRSGVVVWSGSYNSFGKFSSDTSLIVPANVATFSHNLRRPGQYEDAETGLYYNWNRYFDPDTGRYISQDPSGFEGSSLNLYDHGAQNAVNNVDTNGQIVVLIPIIIWAWRLYAIYDLYAQVRDGCFDTRQFLIDQIPIFKLAKKIKFKKIYQKIRERFPPKNCPINSFEEDTLVHVWDEDSQTGITKPIRDIRLGDNVLSYAEAETDPAQALRYEPVVDIMASHKQQVIYSVTLDNGETIKATQGHPFKTAEGWRDAALLTVGSKIISKDSKPGLFAQAVNRTRQALAGTIASFATAAVMAVTPVLVPEAASSTAFASASPASAFLSQGTPAYRTVVAVERDEKVVPVYNLEVRGAHTFFVGQEGVLVHNGGRELKILDYICKKFKINRRAFGDYVESTKGLSGKPGDANFTKEQLEELAQEFCDCYGKGK